MLGSRTFANTSRLTLAKKGKTLPKSPPRAEETDIGADLKIQVRFCYISTYVPLVERLCLW